MRITHVLTLISADGAFGGPVRIAANQVRALREAGHDVRLLAAQSGFGDRVPTRFFDIEVELHPMVRVPGIRLAGVLSPSLLREVARDDADVVHVHLSRDLVTLPSALITRRRGTPYVVQSHGMVMPATHRLAAPLDAVATRRAIAGASSVLALTPAEERGLRQVAHGVDVERLTNGVPVAEEVEPLPERPEVLFVARLHPRKRPAVFARMARRLLADGVGASFRLVGPDQGEAAEVQREVDAVGDPARLAWEGPLAPELVSERMRRASLLVLPALDEPYSMAVLEMLAVGRGAVVLHSCGLAEDLVEMGAGVSVGESEAELTEVVRRLLTSPGVLEEMGVKALAAVRERFDIGSVQRRLEDVYARALT